MDILIAHAIWPLTIFGIIFLFRKEVRNLLSQIGHRSSQITYKGIDIRLGSLPSLPGVSQQSGTKYLQKTYQNKFVTDLEMEIEKYLKNNGLNLHGKETVETLIYHFANKSFENWVLWINKNIYLEQKELLSFINDKPSPVKEDDLKKFFEKFKSNNKIADDKYKYEDFIGYLYQYELLVASPYGYQISPNGIEYLKWLIHMGEPFQYNPKKKKNS